jgi:hypothetical protein
MVRRRQHFVIALGRFNEGVQWVKELNAACKSAGLVEGKLWSVGFGKVNECILEYDYPDMTTMERADKAFFSNAEIMKAFRRGVDIGAPEHWPWDELEVEAPTLA